MVDVPLTADPGAIEHTNATAHEPYADREATELLVRNTGEHIVQIGSHYHFFEANPRLGFDREAAYGKHLAVPPGDRVYFPPGEELAVEVVPYGGERRVRSFYGVVDGNLDERSPSEALSRLRAAVAEPLAAAPEVGRR
jgi:urease beta subunit